MSVFSTTYYYIFLDICLISLLDPAGGATDNGVIVFLILILDGEKLGEIK
jgi:hypothetical protein